MLSIKDSDKCYQMVLRWEFVIENILSYFSTKTYVLGTHKNFLNKTAFWAPKYVKTDG